MGAIQNAINQTLVLGGAATAAKKKDFQDKLEGMKSLAQSSEDLRHTTTKMYNEVAKKKPEDLNKANIDNDNLYKSNTELIKAAADIGKTQGIKGIREQIGNLNYYKDKNDEESKRQMIKIAEMKLAEEKALKVNKARSLSLQKMQQNNQNSEMKKALKQYQYNLTRSKRGG